MSLAYDPILEDEQVIPAVISPYEGTILSVGQHLKISAFWFATNFLWGALLAIMLPAEMKRLAPYFKAPALSMLTGLSAVVALVVPLVAGALSDRCVSPLGRRRPYMIFGIAVNVVGLIGMALALHYSTPIPGSIDTKRSALGIIGILCSNPSFLLVLAAFIVVQFGNNVASAAYSGIIPDLVPEDQRGRASGYMAMLSQFGTLLGVVGVGLVLGKQPEELKYALVCAVLALVASVTILGIRENPLSSRPPKIDWTRYVRTLWIDPRKYPDFAWVWVTRALVMLGFYAIQPFVNYYLDDVIHVKNVDSSAASLIGLLLIASSVSGLAGGYISDRIGRKKVVYLANCVIALSSLSFIWCRNIYEALAAGFIFGLGFGAYVSVDWALGTDVLPSKKDAAKEMAVWHISMTLPQSLAGPLAAILLSWGGMTEEFRSGEPVTHYGAPGYTYVFIMCACFFALGAVLLRNVKSVR
jgi:MFS family permease